MEMSAMVRMFCPMVLWLCLVGLAGCAAPQIARDFKWEADPKIGVVVFSVSHDLAGGYKNQAIVYLDGGFTSGGAHFYSSDGAAAIVRRPSDFSDVQGFLHVVPLAPGTHRFTLWQISNGSGLRIFPRGELKPLEFEVRAGEVTYVGALHGHLLRGENLFGIEITGGGHVGVVEATTRDLALLIQRYPQFDGRVRTARFTSGPWVADGVVPRLDPMPVVR
jgi:hypothetical protein